MSSISRDATVTWQGDLARGEGRLSTGSPLARDAGLSWRERETPTGASTSPEELIAAAHAGCYSMSLSNVLSESGNALEHLEVNARCVARDGANGFEIVAVELTADARVPGLEAGEFESLAREAERRCPVSNAVRGNVEIRLRARLLDG